MERSNKVLNLYCDLDLENNNLIFLHKALQLMMMYHPIKFGCKKISSSADMVETVIFDQMSLKTANQSSCMTLWPMMLHHHTKFGYRRSAAEEISSR